MTDTVTDVRTIAVNVRSQDDALTFFTETLGFDVRLDAPISPTMRWIEVAPPGAVVSLALNQATDEAPSGVDTGVRFSTVDAAAAREQMQSNDVAISDLIQWEDVPPMYTFEDLDGNTFYVVEEQVMTR